LQSRSQSDSEEDAKVQREDAQFDNSKATQKLQQVSNVFDAVHSKLFLKQLVPAGTSNPNSIYGSPYGFHQGE
jgi:hypothetical protein